ncbi:hypothetical protein ACS0TY_032808 [Phlomoides rotata]
MDRLAFSHLCSLLQDLGGLTNSKYVNVQEKVAMFFRQTVSKHFHYVLKSVLKLHSLLLVQPEPVVDDSEDPRWQNFKMVVDPISEQHLDEYLSHQENMDEPNNILGNQMEGAGLVGVQDGEKGKATKGRRIWSKIEEDALIECLTDIVNNGWKADNGFKPGFQ